VTGASGEPGLTGEERKALLAAAREAIAAHLGGRPAALPTATGGLAQTVGVFVTLHRRSDRELRGCVGLLDPDAPLVDTVARMAVAAATADSRFEPVAEREVEGLSIEISALSPLETIRPEDVEVGRHGLVVSAGGRRGVLLPHVPLDHEWDREGFLAQACRKAGLPADAWKQPDTGLQGFTAVVFSDELTHAD